MSGSRFDVSVIIPVEFHRGQAVECVRGWTQEQTYAAERYEVILCAPDTLEPDTEAVIRSLLRAWDRLEKRALHHDMPLVAEAAAMAQGDWLFFSESHCLPESTALATLTSYAEAHPDWVGFSCQTEPITHNPLSEIEAEIYATHIRGELECSPWLKVMDQCFMVRRSAYFAAGGFRPDFGHFAEWLLAAEMHRRGLVVGFCPQRVIRHYYIGEVSDLQAFTLDFARGQIRYLAECEDEPTSEYFAKIPELQEHRQRPPADLRRMLWVKTLALPATFGLLLRKLKNHEPAPSVAIMLEDWLNAVFQTFGIRGELLRASWAASQAKRRLLRALTRGPRATAKAEFIDWFAKLVHLGRMQYLVQATALQVRATRNPNYPVSGKLHFRVASQGNSAAEWLGFYDSEAIPDGHWLRWSRPSACVWLPLHEGRYRVVIEWHKTREVPAHDLLHFAVNGMTLAKSAFQLECNRIILEFTSSKKDWHRLEWTVTPFPAAGDRRPLGLPVTSVHWYAINRPTTQRLDVPTTQLAVHPLYFLHVSKCAGTSLRLILENASHASAILSPYGGRYYPDDLPGLESEPTYAYYGGHFRWALPAALPEQDWNIVTVLRDPVDRILSRFYYLKQHQFIHPALTLEEWIKNGFTFADTMTVHFLPPNVGEYSRGTDEVHRISMDYVDQALTNLRQCLAVGIFENLEDSVNLLAWRTGFLPPRLLPRNNSTGSRIAASQLAQDMRSRLEQLLAADYALYRQAQQRFRAQLDELNATAAAALDNVADTRSTRDWLRQRYLSRLADEGKNGPEPIRIDWTADDIFHGDNLHARELADGTSLRWTGPGTASEFYLYLGAPRDWQLTLNLHEATPVLHAKSLRLHLNGIAIPVQLKSRASGKHEISVQLPQKVLSLSQYGVAEFVLETAITRGANEFRMLGVALVGLSLQALQ